MRLARHDARGSGLAAERYLFREDVHREDLLQPDAGAQRLAFLGEPLAGLHVEIVLVAEAAQQPAAPAGDLRRVEREVLVLGERQTHGPELGQPARAAELPPAPADAVEALGFVPRADLAQLDPRVEQARQIAHQAAAGDALLGR